MVRRSASSLLTSVDELFTTQEERDAAKRESVMDIPLSEISDFPQHPFKVKIDDSMLEMADSVAKYGVLVPAMGTLISPHYLTSAFPKLLEKNGLRKIRFHDLRHSCASLLLTNGVSMKQIQEWLGHSDFSTTANVYAHLDFNSKLSSADAMVAGLQGALNVLQ